MAELILFTDSTSVGKAIEVSADNPLPVTAIASAGGNQTKAATTATSGTVAATNAAGGTQIVAANANRYYTEFTNTGGVDAYFGTGVVTASFEPILSGQTKAWNSIQALKVLSSGANTNIAFTDYINS